MPAVVRGSLQTLKRPLGLERHLVWSLSRPSMESEENRVQHVLLLAYELVLLAHEPFFAQRAPQEPACLQDNVPELPSWWRLVEAASKTLASCGCG